MFIRVNIYTKDCCYLGICISIIIVQTVPPFFIKGGGGNKFKLPSWKGKI